MGTSAVHTTKGNDSDLAARIGDHMQIEESVWTRENRVRLYYLLLKLFPPRISDWSGGAAGGEELQKLEEMLRWKLGKLSLAPGSEVREIIKVFILHYPEGNLLNMIEIVPLVQADVLNEAVNRGEFPLGSPDIVQEIVSIQRQLNTFLEETGSRARFLSNGRFDREGLIQEKPRELLALPDRKSLFSDVDSLLGKEMLGIVFVDLDNFKLVNDTLGHAVGNNCLGAAVRILFGIVKGRGSLYRYGGDEFAIVLRNATQAETHAAAERARKSIEAAGIGGKVSVTASIGCVSSEQPMLRSAQDLIDAADEALLDSKGAGKNRVTEWTPQTEAARGEKLGTGPHAEASE